MLRKPDDDNSGFVAQHLAEKMPEWEALDLIPTEVYTQGAELDRRAYRYMA